VQIPQGEEVIFGGCPDRSEALAIFVTAFAATFATKGIIQSLINMMLQKRSFSILIISGCRW